MALYTVIVARGQSCKKVEDKLEREVRDILRVLDERGRLLRFLSGGIILSFLLIASYSVVYGLLASIASVFTGIAVGSMVVKKATVYENLASRIRRGSSKDGVASPAVVTALSEASALLGLRTVCRVKARKVYDAIASVAEGSNTVCAVLYDEESLETKAAMVARIYNEPGVVKVASPDARVVVEGDPGLADASVYALASFKSCQEFIELIDRLVSKRYREVG